MPNKKTMTIILAVLTMLLAYSITALADKAKKNLRVGELWHQDQDIPSGGWEESYVWPGNHWREKLVGEVRMMNGTGRMSGLGYGMTNWKEYTGITYPYVVGSCSSSLLVHAGGSKDAGQTLKFKLVVRRKPPVTTVDGVVQAPRQDYDEIDPTLPSDVMLLIRFSWETGLTVEQKFYAYACKNADSYMLVDFTAINNGKPDRLPGQVHGWMSYYLQTYLGGIDQFEAYERFGLDMAIYAGPNFTYDERDLANWQVERTDLGTDADGVRSWIDVIKTPEGELHTAGSANDR